MRMIKCRNCAGKGEIKHSYNGYSPCNVCGGTGKTVDNTDNRVKVRFK